MLRDIPGWFFCPRSRGGIPSGWRTSGRSGTPHATEEGVIVFVWLNPDHENREELKIGYALPVDDTWWVGGLLERDCWVRRFSALSDPLKILGKPAHLPDALPYPHESPGTGGCRTASPHQGDEFQISQIFFQPSAVCFHTTTNLIFCSAGVPPGGRTLRIPVPLSCR